MLSTNIENNTIIVAKRKLLPKLIEKIRKETFLNIKFMTLKDLRYKYSFKYDEKTIYYLIKNYQYNYDVAVKILENIYYIEDKDYKNEKLNNLFKIKKELLDNKVLYNNPLFIDNLKKYKIIIYNYNNLSKYDSNFINKLKKITSIEIINDEKDCNNNKIIYEFNTIEEEVVFIAESISKQIADNYDINKIKICGINDEYNTIIKRVFNYYHIPIIINKSKIYGTKISKLFFEYLDSDINNTINKLKEEIDLKNEDNLNIYNTIIDIVNKYRWSNNYLEIKELLINDFKNTKINKNDIIYKTEIIDSLDEASDNDYIYLMNFNQGSIPNIYKDEDYLSDKLKKILKIDTSQELNKLSTDKWLYDIKYTKNLIITYKKNSNRGESYLSSLNDYLNYQIETKKINYSNYSNLYNKIELTKKIDKLIKYNTHDKYLDILFNNYKDLKYSNYDNKYTGINNLLLKDYLKNKLTLSYTSIDNYYHCSFKYYLSNILKINKYEKTFYTIIGNLFHYILSISLDKDIDIKKEYYNYIEKEDYNFNARERFFLDNLYEELIFIIDTIKEQNEYNSLNTSLYENKISIDKSKEDYNINFIGLIDKIMMNDDNLATIIDYKTGSADINLNNIVYGLSLQLPVYIYLFKNKYPQSRIIGFYLQKILNSEIKIDHKHTYKELKKEKLKLQGYTSMYDKDIMQFDKSYNESKVIKGMRTTSKGLSSKKVYDDELIDNIYKLVDNKINTAIDNILNASFTINPKKIGMDNIGCKYCSYKDICFMKEKDIINLKEHKDLSFLKENT